MHDPAPGHVALDGEDLNALTELDDGEIRDARMIVQSTGHTVSLLDEELNFTAGECLQPKYVDPNAQNERIIGWDQNIVGNVYVEKLDYSKVDRYTPKWEESNALINNGGAEMVVNSLVPMSGVPVEKLNDIIAECDAPRYEDLNAPKYPSYGSHKAHVPIAKFRNALDDEEAEDRAGFRCAECARCITCKTSSKKTAISLREAREQQIIEESVKIDLERRRVVVNYPFLKDPVACLCAVHKNPNNYLQALKVYKTQCRKSEMGKEGMRKVHKDLVDKGFMIKLERLDPVKRKVVEMAPFQHYNPWRLVMKMDSVTTPVRMVVDPTMTKFNEILAKGENRMGSIFSIMIRCRCTEHIWSSDINKLYNQLILDDPSLPYSLFLYGEELNQDKEPEVWVMVRAWYGIVSTGGQAGFALDKLTKLMAKDFPQAYKTLRENRYVDDILSGAETKNLREDQINAVEEVLKMGGFITGIGRTKPEQKE